MKHLTMNRNVVGDIPRRAAANAPSRLAVVFESTRLTFAEFDTLVDKCAHGLAALGYGPGTRVAILSANCHQFFVTWFAVARAGMVLVPINTRLTAGEIEYILNDSQSAVAFVEDSQMARVGEVFGKVPCIRTVIGIGLGGPPLKGVMTFDELLTQGKPEPFEGDVDDEDYVQILYTSGTESNPKGVLLRHGPVMLNMIVAAYELNYRASDINIAALPLFHNGQLNHMATPVMLAGGASIFLREFDPRKVLEAIHAERGTLFFGIPAMYTAMLKIEDFDEFDLSSLRFCACNMAPASQTAVNEFVARFGCGFGLSFGQTEAGPFTLYCPPEDYLRKFGSIGRPVLGVKAKIVDDEDREVPAGTVGEIVYQSPSIMDSYLGLQKKTEDAFRGGWLHSGDLAFKDEDGFFFFMDRKKDMIKTGGENVSTLEVERVILGHPAVQQVSVLGMPHARWGEAVTAAVVLRQGESVSSEELIAYCRKHLAGYKIPKQVVFLPILPLTSTGKNRKHILREQLSRLQRDGQAPSFNQ